MFAVAVSLAYYANFVREERDDFPEGLHHLFDELSDTMSADVVSNIIYTPGNDATSSTTYTTHTHISHTNIIIYIIIYIYIYIYVYIYIYIYIYIVPWKAILIRWGQLISEAQH